jgi:hypothetical protein
LKPHNLLRFLSQIDQTVAFSRKLDNHYAPLAASSILHLSIWYRT